MPAALFQVLLHVLQAFGVYPLKGLLRCSAFGKLRGEFAKVRGIIRRQQDHVGKRPTLGVEHGGAVPRMPAMPQQFGQGKRPFQTEGLQALRKFAADGGAAGRDAHRGEDLSQPFAQPERQTRGRLAQQGVRVFMGRHAVFRRADPRHHNVVAVFRSDVIGIGRGANAVGIVSRGIAERHDANGRALIESEPGMLHGKGSQLFQPEHGGTRVGFGGLKIDFKVGAAGHPPFRDGGRGRLGCQAGNGERGSKPANSPPVVWWPFHCA